MSQLTSDYFARSELSHPIEGVCRGGHLAAWTVEGVPASPRERMYAELHASGWRYVGLDVVYEKRTLLMGGPILMGFTAISSAIGNRRRRAEAERVAAPQWRPLGPLRIVVTSERLFIRHGDAWWSVWYSGITAVSPNPAGHRLDLFFREDPPYRLAGPDVPALGAVLAHGLDLPKPAQAGLQRA